MSSKNSKTYSEKEMMDFNHTLAEEIFECMSANTVPRTALRVHEILLKKPSLQCNPVIQDYRAFIGLLYLFIVSGSIRVIGRHQLGGDRFEEAELEPTTIDDLNNFDKIMQAGYIAESYFYNLLLVGITHTEVTETINSASSNEYEKWQVRNADKLAKNTLFYQLVNRRNSSQSSELPQIPEIVR